MRGVFNLTIYIDLADCGSSPHARGFRVVLNVCNIKTRFIPACAGFSRVGVFPVACVTVHPRMRGVFSASVIWSWSRLWFIPACAGFSLQRGYKDTYITVHPRMRGVFAPSPPSFYRPCGSSPHARGFPKNTLISSRNIPVHPRMRGFSLSKSSLFHNFYQLYAF